MIPAIVALRRPTRRTVLVVTVVVSALLAGVVVYLITRPDSYTVTYRGPDVAVYLYSPELHVWLPASDEIDTVAHTVRHLGSQWTRKTG